MGIKIGQIYRNKVSNSFSLVVDITDTYICYRFTNVNKYVSPKILRVDLNFFNLHVAPQWVLVGLENPTNEVEDQAFFI